MNKRLQLLFEMYLDGTITPSEKKELFSMLTDPANKNTVNGLMDSLWETIPDQPVSLMNREEAFDKLQQHITSVNQPKQLPQNRFKILKVAAAVAFLFIASAALFLYAPILKSSDHQVFAVGDDKTDAHFLRLPDGSTVLLNEGSKLEYPTSFNNETREVYLQGEAFFDIQHNSEKPFVVKTSDVTTTVLGTAFNIRAFPDDKHVVVTVSRGKVKVSKDEKVLGVITRDQQITVERQTSVSHQASVNSRETTEWMERDIHFNDVTMDNAVAELSNRFNVDIELKNEKLRECKFTATFVKGEDVEQILIVLTEFNNATFTFDKTTRKVVIDGEGCQTKREPNPTQIP